MKQRLILILGLLVFAAGFVLPRGVQAQTTASSTVVGTVTDPSGAAVPGATVKLTNVGTNVPLTATANDSGQYTFPTVTPGTYALEVSKQGFKNGAVQNLVVEIAKSYTVNVTLQVGAMSQSVTVEAGANVQLETTTAQVSGSVSSQEMDKLPTLNHQATELITIQPSVSPGMEVFPMTQPRFSGALDDQNTYTLDGVDISDNLVGDGTWVPVNIDSVQEADIGVSTPNATFGRSSGGQIALLGRHGTNQYHGSAYWYAQNSALNANSWDLNSVGVQQPHLEDNFGGGRFGGPIIKNKTFIFVNYELNRFPESTTFTRDIPTPSLRQGILTFKDAAGNIDAYNLATSTACGPSGGLPCDPRGIGISPLVQQFWNLEPAAGNSPGGDGLNETGYRGTVSTPLDTDFGVLRLDHNFSDKWRFSGSYTYYRDISNPGAQISILNGTPSSPSSDPTRDVMVTGQLTTLISPSLTNTFRFGWVRNWQNSQVETPAQSAAQFNLPNTASGVASDPFISLNPAEGLVASPIDNTPDNARFQDYFEKNIQFTDGIDWIKGKHTLEFGTDDRHLPLLTDRADTVVGGVTSLESTLDTVDGAGGFLSLPAANAPPTCSATILTNCLTAGEIPQWNQLYAGALGLVDNTSIFAVRNGSLSPLPFGTPLSNNTVQNQFYFYGQDVWRLTNSLTVSYGLAYGWQSPPVDTLGRQTILDNDVTGQPLTAPTYLSDKMTAALQGQIYNPTTDYVPVNTAGSPVFNTDYGDLAPRVSIAWNPSFGGGAMGDIFGDRKTVIRAGYSLVYDRESTIETVVIPMLGVGFGQTLTEITPGCGSPCSNPAATDFRAGVDGNLAVPVVQPEANPIVPSTPFGNFISFQDDPDMKVGRSTNLDLDIQRELPGNMLLEVGYVGNMGSRLPTSVDINDAPYFFKDAGSGQSFAQAFDTVSGAVRAGVAPNTQPWFENQLPGYASSVCGGGTNTACLASQLGSFFSNGDVQSLFQQMDLYRLGQGLQPYDNLQNQVSVLRTYLGTSSYNALIVSLQKKTSAGLTFQVNYTLSKSLDESLLNQNSAGYFLNSYSPDASYGPSLYDRKNMLTADYVYQLPVGNGHRLHLNNGLDRAVSGWYWSGIFTAYSGLPLTVAESADAWGVSSILGANVPAIPTVPTSQLNGSVHSGVVGSDGIGTATAQSNGGTGLNIFSNPAAVFADFRDINLATDGRDGSANPFRGLPMWNMDMALGKSTKIRENITADFSAQFLNVFNNVNFQNPGGSTGGLPLSLQSPQNFGEIDSTVIPANRTNSARWIELGLRVSF
ncbi:MAG: carboxypeptidase-like regulatory domain-containing protein [Candidatus Acidiferrales bacterium]